jgi:Rieske Fe-S protein
MATKRWTRKAFMAQLGSLATAAVGLSIVMTPRRVLAVASGAGSLTKVTTLQKLKVGVNGPFTFQVSAPAPNTNEIFLVRSAKGSVTALEATCRHMGCPVAWTAKDDRFECPCHGSEYAISGKVVHGPATKNLYQHNVALRAGQVWVFSTRLTS